MKEKYTVQEPGSECQQEALVSVNFPFQNGISSFQTEINLVYCLQHMQLVWVRQKAATETQCPSLTTDS